MKNEAEKGMSFHAKTVLVTALVAVAVVIALGFTILNQSGYLYTGLTAVEVNGEKYSAADFNFYYMYAYNNYYSYLSDLVGEEYASGLMPTNGTSFRDQVTNEETGETWYDTLKEMALNNMEQITDLKNRAAAEGFTIPADYAARADADIEDMTASAVTSGYTLEQFLRNYYGAGMTEKVLRRNLELYYLGQAYSAAQMAALSFTTEEKLAEYEANKDKNAYYSFYLLSVPAEAGEDGTVTDEAKAAAKAKAEEIAASATDESSLILAGVANGYTASPYTSQGSQLAEEYVTWLADASRKTGDTTVFEATDAYYVFLYGSRDDNDYNTVNASYIAVSVVTPTREETDTDESYTAKSTAAIEAAEATANEINAAWQSGTYADFAALTAAFTGSFSGADTYTQVGRNEVGVVFTDWLFDEPHAAGDSTVLSGDSTMYVLIYEGEGENLRELLGQESLLTAASNEWSAGIGEGYEAVEKSGMRYTGGIWYEKVSY